MAKRRGEEAPALLVIGAFVLVADGVYTLRVARAGAGYLALLVLVALGAALFLPIALRSGSILTARRIRLLPVGHSQFVVLRLFLADPARVLACIIVLGWGIVGFGILPIGMGARIVGTAQLVAWVAAGLMLVSVLEDSLGRVAPTTFYLIAMGIALLSAQLLAVFDNTWAEARDLPGGFLRTLRVVMALGVSSSAGDRLAGLLTIVAVSVLLFWIARSVTGRALRPSSAPSAKRGHDFVASITRRLVPQHAAATAAALAMLTRVYTPRSGWVLTILFAVAGFALPVPAFLIGVFLFWAVFSHNMLGPDVPYGGTLRFSLMPYPAFRAVQVRRRVLLVTATALVFAVALAASVIRGWNGLFTHALAFLFGAGWFGLASIGGDLVSRRYPKSIALRALMMRDGYVRPIAWLVMAVTSVFVGMICIGAYFVSRAMHRGAPAHAQVVWAYAMATAVMLIISGAVLGRRRE